MPASTRRISWYQSGPKLIIGLIAGFLASRVMRGGGYGLIGDIVVGLIGALNRGMEMH